MSFWKIVNVAHEEVLFIKAEDEDGASAIEAVTVINGVTGKFTFGGYESHEKRNSVFDGDFLNKVAFDLVASVRQLTEDEE